jgi:hypothetical protein
LGKVDFEDLTLPRALAPKVKRGNDVSRWF